MSDLLSQELLRPVTLGKLWNSECQQAMRVYGATGAVIYQCSTPCGQHTAAVESVHSGLLWHYRGRKAGQTYGLPDDSIIDEMLSVLRKAWVRNGRIYTVQFD